MKCYIATFFQYDNYGTRLQNFALCQAIKEAGAVPVTLVLDNKREKYYTCLKMLLSYLPAVNDRQRRWICDRKKKKAFQAFRHRLCMQKVKYKQLFRIDFTDAVAIAGSDQIWSPKHLHKKRRERELFFLRFAPENKRYAYAPSFGVHTIPNDMEELYQKYISDFEQVSVREKKGKAIIQNLCGLDACILPDPVFLLKPDKWRETAHSFWEDGFNENYVLTYFLSGQDEAVWKKIEKYACEKDAEIICIAGNIYERKNITPAPEEFLFLIDNARALFTDSFHASAFSIIFQTPFQVFLRSDVQQFSRLETLLSHFKMENAFADGKKLQESEVRIPENATRMEKMLERDRIKGMNYLKQIIRNENKKTESSAEME